ncbi:MAG: branched-chain amino acid ABC transporter permease [Myxococcales bacterium]|nr:branched-chain amino acid ABC transporter permease [Myxococcales bacterium]
MSGAPASKNLASRVRAHRPNPVLNTGLGLLPFVAAFVLAMVFDTVIGPMVGATWSKILTDVGIAIVLAGSLNIVNGYAGQFSIGHAGFMLVGGYAAAWLTFYGSVHFFGTKETVGAFLGSGQQLFLAGCMLGGLIAAAFGVIVGLPSLRLRGDYLAIVTLGFGEIARVLGQITARQPKDLTQIKGRSLWDLADNLGGAEGFSQIPGYTRLFFVYLFAFVLLVLVYRLKYSSKGRELLAVRENEIAAEAMGIDTTRAKVAAFVLAAFFAGIGGALYAHQVGAIDPKELGFQKSIDLVIIVVIGGMGSITGVVLGASILVILPELFREFSEYRMIAYALALIAVMILRPQGIMGVKELWELSWWRRAAARLRPRKKGASS